MKPEVLNTSRGTVSSLAHCDGGIWNSQSNVRFIAFLPREKINKGYAFSKVFEHITKTRPCNIMQFFTAVKKIICDIFPFFCSKH